MTDLPTKPGENEKIFRLVNQYDQLMKAVAKVIENVPYGDLYNSSPEIVELSKAYERLVK